MRYGRSSWSLSCFWQLAWWYCQEPTTHAMTFEVVDIDLGEAKSLGCGRLLPAVGSLGEARSVITRPLRRMHSDLMLAAMSLAIALPMGAAPQVGAAGSYTYETKGLDSACAPTTSQMNAFWNGTPYYHWYIYVGGANRSCKNNTNLTASWVSTNGPASTKWGLVPIWVGLQAPCTTPGKYYVFSYNTTTAYNQGYSEAQSAASAVFNLGFSSNVPIVFDLEYWDTSNNPCVAAVRSFILGWVDWLHVPPSQKAGVYGSVCASGLNSLATITHPPDWIWGAYYQTPPNPSTSNMACIPSSRWVYHQRHKQYVGSHNETWNRATLNVDNDCANGPVYANHDSLYDSACL